eukprot:MONOS_5060.2-p1 / transcript=MONOS_5060.2 / gene=MONOS_5060 / organism=Monocercomonoides_exilis_PA203 / gene_product=unspecified product / transcript_product=unspecified product / location=Mono_scaffold00143:69995-71881(+) / protein_length=426 / sequence_SO=supercontig / SO=protein_coding / is_pseudo=false
MSFILFTLTWISLMMFLFFFFFAIFYATNFIRGPVFDKLADDGYVTTLVTNKVTRSVFSFSLSRSKGQFTVALVMLTLFFFFFHLYMKERKYLSISIIMFPVIVGFLLITFVFLCVDLDSFVNGDKHTFNIRNRLVDGPVTKPYPQRSIKLSQVYYFETRCSKSVRCCGIVFGSAIGIVIVLIPSLCLDGIGKFDPPTSSGEAWEGAERLMSVVVVTDELIERAHKMERNMMLSLAPMLMWLFVEYVVFCVGLYLVKGDVKWVKRRLDLKKGLFVWQALAPSKRSREMQEIRAEEWKRRKTEKMRKKQEEQEREEKEEAKEKAKEKREKEKDLRLIEVTQRGLKPEELSAAIDEINKYYDEEYRKEAGAEEAEKKRAEEKANKKEKEENAKENENQSIFDEPPINRDIHELWEKILRKGSFSWLV